MRELNLSREYLGWKRPDKSLHSRYQNLSAEAVKSLELGMVASKPHLHNDADDRILQIPYCIVIQ